MPARGHLWTIGARLWRALRPPAEPPWEPWSTSLHDPVVGTVRLTGKLTGAAHERLLLVVHGLGGSCDSAYAVRLAAAAARDGWAVLRLNLRGADRRGEDFYHAGLTADLEAALGSPALDGYREAAIAGFSLGGHVALRLATEPTRDPRLRRVAAVCSPLDLAAGQRAIDRPGHAVYRGYVLRRLVEIYAAVARRRPVPEPVAIARGIRRIRAWDERIVAPRHGFTGADDYYRRASVGPRLDRLAVPALLVVAEQDPMVPVATLEGALSQASPALDVRRAAGGHVTFPRRLDLGLGPRRGLEAQLLHWLDGEARPSPRRRPPAP